MSLWTEMFIMLVRVMLHPTYLWVTLMLNNGLAEPKNSSLKLERIWSPHFQLKPSHVYYLNVESHDVISHWPGHIFDGFNQIAVRFQENGAPFCTWHRKKQHLY